MEKENKDQKETKTQVDPFAGFSILKGNSMASPENKDTTKETEVKEGVDDATELTEEEIIKAQSDAKEAAELEAKKTKKPAKETKAKVTEETEEEDTTQGNEDTTAQESVFKLFLTDLTEQGIVEALSDEEFEDSPEAIAKAVQKTLTKGIEDFKKGRDPQVQQFEDFVAQGGNPKQFFEVFYGNTSWENYKLDGEHTQKEVVRSFLKTSGWDDTEIDAEIKDAEDLGKLEAKAKAFLPKLQKLEELEKTQLIENQSNLAKQRETEAKAYWDNLQKDWMSKSEVNGFKLTDKIKKDVWEHMTSVDRKTGKTKMQQNYETNKESQFLYAYLDMMNWDIKKLEKQVETKVTSSLRQKLENYTDTRAKTGKMARTNVQEQEENPFAGFKTL